METMNGERAVSERQMDSKFIMVSIKVVESSA